jgi:GNAT superfamily N-acetyltransferase
MYKIYSRQELKDRELLGVIDIIINEAHEEGNGEAFKDKYHPYNSPGETFVALWEGRPAGMVSCEPSIYTGDPDVAARACRLHVLKDYRAKQIGFGLLDACYKYCIDKYKILYITHDVNAKAMNAIYQKKKMSLFKGASRNPYDLEAWKRLEWNKEYLFKVDPIAEFYQNIYQIVLEEGFHWKPKTNVVEFNDIRSR